MKKLTAYDLAALLVLAGTVTYLCLTYAKLPATVPLHFNAEGKVDRYGSKGEFLGVMIFMNGIAAGTYLLLKFLPAIDPKKKVAYSEGTLSKLGFGLLFFLSVLSIAIIYITGHAGVPVDRIILPIVAIMFAFIGNVMNSLKPNYFAGIRTPWTLESEDTWRATHRLAGKLWFLGGLLLAFLVFIIPGKVGFTIYMCGIGALVFVPVIYSYLYFKKHQLK